MSIHLYELVSSSRYLFGKLVVYTLSTQDFHLLLCLMTTIIRYNKFYRGFGVMGSFCPLGYVNYVCNF